MKKIRIMITITITAEAKFSITITITITLNFLFLHTQMRQIFSFSGQFVKIVSDFKNLESKEFTGKKISYDIQSNAEKSYEALFSITITITDYIALKISQLQLPLQITSSEKSNYELHYNYSRPDFQLPLQLQLLQKCNHYVINYNYTLPITPSLVAIVF